MAEEYVVKIDGCDESHCDSCGLCDKGSLYNESLIIEEKKQLTATANNLVLLDMGVKKIGAFLIDGSNGQNLGSLTSLNQPEGDILGKVSDLVVRVSKDKELGLIVLSGNWEQCNRLNGVSDINGVRVIRIPCISKNISNSMLCGLQVILKEEPADCQLLINMSGNGEVVLITEGKIWAASSECEGIFDDRTKWMLMLQKAYEGDGASASCGLIYPVGKEAFRNTVDELIKASQTEYNNIVKATIISGASLVMDQNIAFIEDIIPEVKGRVDGLNFNPVALRGCDYLRKAEDELVKDVNLVNIIYIVK